MSSRNYQNPPSTPQRTRYNPVQMQSPPQSPPAPPSRPNRLQRNPPQHLPGPSIESHNGRDYYSPPPSTEEHAMLVQHPQGNTRRERDEYVATQGVATGAIGGGFGPYSGIPPTAPYNPNRFSSQSNPSIAPSIASEKYQTTTAPPTPAPLPSSHRRTNTVGFIWDSKDPDLDDALHNPDPVRDAILDRRWTIFSFRGLENLGAIFIICATLITMFAGYPIAAWYRKQHPTLNGYNLGGINGTGQIPVLNVPRLIDATTPKEAYSRTGFDGQAYSLVFSDEFNIDGRSFYEGDDPFWEAVDLHYWQTGDLEWYRQDAITTEGGSLIITLTEEPIHGLNFRSGMLQSWNKFCFTRGYIEVNMSLPGDPRVPGLWPAAWTMGNLARIGYGATTDGLWPYSYDTCDVGTFPNQTRHDNTPAAALGGLSYQPGQRLSSCTCPGSDHPGPNVGVGRGAPEIDIIEADTDLTTLRGSASQSMQTAPYNAQYQFPQSGASIFNSSETTFNSYAGGPYQQALSGLSDAGVTAYGGKAYQTYGFEYWSNPKDQGSGFVTWAIGGVPTWTANAAALGPDSQTEVSQRLIPVEPMAIALNLGLAPSFQKQDWKHLVFPARMYVDYVRVYQRNGETNIGCDPKDYPTADYIQRHPNAYTNPNATVWSQAGYDFPRNQAYDGC